ncbi:MAG: hypothetical protein J7L42_01545 [Elusimicrobia bacterium]|nr:hypothetical protein [Elusimicrobiota bacterium]
MSLRKEILKMIKEMPEGINIEDIMAELYFRFKVEKGLNELSNNKCKTHETVKAKVEKWLKWKNL